MTAPDGISGWRTRPIFVLGIDRSGTSLLAEVVARWGAYAGEPESLADPDDGNPRGYWEHMPMQELMMQLGSESLAGECSPAIDVYETDDSLEIAVDLPGVDAAAIRVLSKGDGILIAGEKAARRGRGESSFHLVERGYGRFPAHFR